MSSICCTALSEIWEVVRLVWRELFVCIIVLLPTQISMTVDSTLQEDTFGKDKFYLYSGLLNTLGGLVSVIAGVVLGSLSDFLGRNHVVLICACILAIPPILAATTENYWVFYVSRALCMWNGAAFSTVMASIVDKIRRSTQEEELEVDEGIVATSAKQDNNPTDDDERTKLIGTNKEDEQVIVSSPPTNNENENEHQQVEEKEREEEGRTEVSKKRTLTFIIAILTFIVSMMIGSSIGTSIPEVRYKFCAQLGLAVVAILFVMFVGISNKEPIMKEVLKKVEQEVNDNNSRKIHHAHTTGEKIGKLFKNKNLVIMFFVVFFDFISEEALQSSMLLYVKGSLHFSSPEQQALLICFGASSIFSLLVVGRIFSHYFSIMTSLRIAMFMNVFGSISFGLSKEKWMLFLLPSISSVSTLMFGYVNSLASLLAADEDAGAAQGFITAARFFAQGVSPSVFGAFLQAMKGREWPLPGIPFVAAAGGPVIALILSLFLPTDIGEKKKEKKN